MQQSRKILQMDMTDNRRIVVIGPLHRVRLTELTNEFFHPETIS